MEPELGPSPTWFGVLAIASFAVLVIVAFASGYHLVADDAGPARRERAGADESAREGVRDGAARERK